MGVLDRYVVREILPSLALGAAVFTFFLLIDRLYHLTDLVITKGVPFHLVAQLLAFMLPSFLAHTLPMALLAAILLAGGRLAGDLEVIACKAAGISLLRLFRPVLAVALAITMLTAALTLVVNPLASREFQRQLFRILQARAITGLQERVFNTTFGDVTIYVEEISPSHMALRGLLVSDERDPRLSRIVTAQEGRVLTDEERRRITLRLLDGTVSEADIVPRTPDPAAGRRPEAPAAAASAERYRHTLFSLYDLSLAVDSPLGAAARAERPERELGLGALARRIESLRGDAHGQIPFLLEWHKRFAIPLGALVFALVGFPLAVRSHRGGRSVALAGSLGVFLAYYLVLTSLEGAAGRQQVPPWLAVWGPSLLFAAAGAGLLTATLREWRLPHSRLAWDAAGAVRETLRQWWRTEPASPIRGRDSTHIIDRYLVREYLTFIAAGVAVAATLVVVVELMQRFDRFLRSRPPLLYIVEHFAYRVPAIVHEGLPVIMLLATIFLYLTLTRHHELTALKAAGVSLYRVSAPVLALGLAVAIGSGMFQELVLPWLNERSEEVDRVKIRGQLPRHLQSRQRLWLRSAETRFYRVELLVPGSHDLYGVTVLQLDRDFRLASRLDAGHAHWTEAGWELRDGAFRELGRNGQVQTLPFARTAVLLPERLEDFTEIQKPVTAMSYRELREYVVRLEAAGFQVRKYLVELHSKLSFPLVNVVMVLVAIPFALQAPRGGGRLFGIALAIVIMASYLVVHYVAVAFGRADLLPPALAAWTANVIFLGVGAALFLRART